MSVLFKMVDASGGAVTGATVSVTVDGQAGGGTVTEVGGGWYRYTFGTGEGSQPCVVKATATLCQAVEVVYDPTLAKQATLIDVQSDVAAVKATTDGISFSADGDVKATLDGEKVTVSTNEDKTGYSLTSAYDAAKTAASQSSVDALADAVSAVDGVVDGLDSRLTAARAANLDNLDASVSSRLAASSYVAPDNATIASIDGKVDAISDVLGAQGSAGVVAITQDTLDTKGTPLGYVRVNGVPYAGALVELLAYGAARRWTVTDGDGGFSIAAERGAVYQVRVTVPNAPPSVKTVEVK